MQAQDVVKELTRALAPAGINIVQPLSLDWYNSCLPETASTSRIPRRDPAGSKALTILIGNSAAIWEPFLTACATDSSILYDPNPLETYIERKIQPVLDVLVRNHPCRLFWSHSMADLEGGRGFVAMQRMAECSGLAYLDHMSHLSMHPEYGPWFSLRCALVIDDVAYADVLQPEPVACPLDDLTSKNVRAAADLAHRRRKNDGNVPEMEDVRAGWELWLAVRDAATPAHPQRYCADQVLYHYTGDRNLLKALVEKRTKENQHS